MLHPPGNIHFTFDRSERHPDYHLQVYGLEIGPDILRTSDFDYDLPASFIAQVPIEPRDHSRLMVLGRESGEIEHRIFKEIGKFLNPGDILVTNETRVIPGRLFGRKFPSGGRVEILLLRRRDDRNWEVLVGGKGLNEGKRIQVETKSADEANVSGEIIEVLEGAERVIQFDPSLDGLIDRIGHIPLPPYIHTRLEDPERYQTVYATDPGSAAAPTAGLHFTPQLIQELRESGINFAAVTLHVGLDTFAPVNEEDPWEHKIHTEWCRLKQEDAERINQVKQGGGRVVAVGTTSVRTLEHAAVDGKVRPVDGPTSLYILPGYQFQVVDAMITNFHLPRSTLIMMVSAFTGRENILRAYEIAKKEQYRFYSFGDAMLII